LIRLDLGVKIGGFLKELAKGRLVDSGFGVFLGGGFVFVGVICFGFAVVWGWAFVFLCGGGFWFVWVGVVWRGGGLVFFLRLWFFGGVWVRVGCCFLGCLWLFFCGGVFFFFFWGLDGGVCGGVVGCFFSFCGGLGVGVFFSFFYLFVWVFFFGVLGCWGLVCLFFLVRLVLFGGVGFVFSFFFFFFFMPPPGLHAQLMEPTRLSKAHSFLFSPPLFETRIFLSPIPALWPLLKKNRPPLQLNMVAFIIPLMRFLQLLRPLS